MEKVGGSGSGDLESSAVPSAAAINGNGNGGGSSAGDEDGLGPSSNPPLPPSLPPPPPIVTSEDVDFLPQIYDIIKSVERESNESSQAKRSEFQDTSGKVVEFQKKLDSVRDQIKKLPGIDYSKEDQLKRLEALRKQLVLKKKLLQKYKDMCALEGVKQYLTPTTTSSS